MTATSSELMSGLTPQGDPGLLRIALDNLLGNAWKYAGRQPETRIEFGATMEKAAWFTLALLDRAQRNQAWRIDLYSNDG